MYDYGARHYMADIGRWGVIDPLAELTPNMTPFRYGFNNPIMFYDAYGLWEQTAGGYTTDKKEDIQRFFDMMDIEKVNEGDTSMDQVNSFVSGEYYNESTGGGKLSDGSLLLSNITATGDGKGNWNVSDAQMFKTSQKVYNSASYSQNHKDFDMLNDPMYNLNMNIARTTQKWGGRFSKAGYGLTLSVKGAPIGIPMSTVGSAASLIGDAHEAVTALYFGDMKKVRENAAFYVISKSLEISLKKIPYMDEFAQEVLNQGVGIKLDIAKGIYQNSK